MKSDVTLLVILSWNSTFSLSLPFFSEFFLWIVVSPYTHPSSQVKLPVPVESENCIKITRRAVKKVFTILERVGVANLDQSWKCPSDSELTEEYLWPLWVTQCLSLPSLEVGNLSRVFHLTSCLLPPTLRITGPGQCYGIKKVFCNYFLLKVSPPMNLLATIRKGDGGCRGPSGPGLRSSSLIWKQKRRLTSFHKRKNTASYF